MSAGGPPQGGGDELVEIADVNVVPLADVSLVLLIILLVLSPMMTQQALRVQTAAEKKVNPAEPLPPLDVPQRAPDLVLVVALAVDRITVADRTFTTFPEFSSFMSGLMLARADKKVFLSPGPDVPHGRVVSMLETLQQVGASSVALVQSAPASLGDAGAPETSPALPVSNPSPGSGAGY